MACTILCIRFLRVLWPRPGGESPIHQGFPLVPQPATPPLDHPRATPAEARSRYQKVCRVRSRSPGDWCILTVSIISGGKPRTRIAWSHCRPTASVHHDFQYYPPFRLQWRGKICQRSLIPRSTRNSLIRPSRYRHRPLHTLLLMSPTTMMIPLMIITILCSFSSPLS